MKLFFAFRPINLFMLFIMACLIYWSFFPALNIEPKMTLVHFILLNFSLILITAAGYLINDKHDILTDQLNQKTKKHQQFLVSKKSRFTYWLLTLSGLFLGIYISIIYKNWFALLSFIFAFVTLHIYNQHLKKHFLLGNLATSLLISLAILLYPSFEIDIFNFGKHSTLILYFYAISSFLLNLAREIIKDMEDIIGDFGIGLKTLPIMIGKKRSKNIVFFIIIFNTILSILFFTYYFVAHAKLISSAYIFVIFPSLIISYFINQSRFKKDYTRISNYLKILAGLGLLSILLFNQI